MTSRTARLLMALWLLTALVAIPHTPTVTHAATNCSDEATTGIPQAECEALVTFYNSTNGPNWTNKDGWNDTNTPCAWSGVTCVDGHVTELGLSYNQLSGSIPPEMGNLQNLTELSLFRNQLSGSIPPEMGNLQNLTSLSLSINQLEGNIPPQLGNLSNLESLSLDDSQLNGNIPPRIRQPL